MTTLKHSFGILAPESLLPILRQGLGEAGYDPFFSFDPSLENDRDLPPVSVILVVLSGEMEKSLGHLEDRLYAEGQETLFDESEDREAWDAARWGNHLAPKLAPLLNTDSPRTDNSPKAPLGFSLEDLPSDGLMEREPHLETEPAIRRPHLSEVPLDSADDFLAEAGSPIFQGGMESPDTAEEPAPKPPTQPPELPPFEMSEALPPPTSPSPPLKAPKAPAGWSLESPGEEDTYEPSPAKPSSGMRFDTGGLSFVDASGAKEEPSKGSTEQKQEGGGQALASAPEEPYSSHPHDSTATRVMPNPGFVLILGGMGGPAPVKEILGHLDSRLPVPVVIRQHLPQGRYDALAVNLGKQALIPVHLAQEGTQMKPGCAWVLEDGLVPELSQSGEWVAVAGDIALAVSRVGDTEGALLAVSGTGQEIVFPAMEALAAGALLIGQDPEQAYDSEAIDTLVDLGMVIGTAEELGAHLMEHWGMAPTSTNLDNGVSDT